MTGEVIRFNSVLQSLLLMAEAVMIMSQGNIIASNLSRQRRVQLHWILQASAAAFIFAGFLVIVINKNLHSKNHFKTWHSVIGLVFLVFVGVTSSGGVVTLYSLRLKQYVKPAKMKLFHNVLGVLTFVIGVASEMFGIYSHWFARHASLSAQVVCTVFVVLGGIFTVESAVKSAYARFKALQQSV
jgi:Eukaryotic cytochrome b561.